MITNKIRGVEHDIWLRPDHVQTRRDVLVVEKQDCDFGLVSDLWGSMTIVTIVNLEVCRVTVSTSNPGVYPIYVSIIYKYVKVVIGYTGI